MLTAPRPRAAQLSDEPLAAVPCDAAALPLPLSCCSLCMPSKGPWASEMSPSLFIFSILTGQARSKLATGSARQTLLHSSLVSCQSSAPLSTQRAVLAPRAARAVPLHRVPTPNIVHGARRPRDAGGKQARYGHSTRHPHVDITVRTSAHTQRQQSLTRAREHTAAQQHTLRCADGPLRPPPSILRTGIDG